MVSVVCCVLGDEMDIYINATDLDFFSFSYNDNVRSISYIIV